jgi:hypothetical protein
MWVGGQRQTPATLRPGRTRYMGGNQGRSGQVRKVSPPPPGFDPQTIQPVASHYTDWAIPVHGPSVQNSNWVHRLDTGAKQINSITQNIGILCSWFRASCINVSNCPTICDYVQFIIQGVSKRALQLWKLIEIYTENIHKVLNCQNVAKHTEFYLG